MSSQRSQRYIETIDELNKRISKAEFDSTQMRAERTNLLDEINEYQKKIVSLEEKLVAEVNHVRESSDQQSGKLLAKLEADLERKVRSEKALEEKLAESKARHEKFEGKVDCFAIFLKLIVDVLFSGSQPAGRSAA